MAPNTTSCDSYSPVELFKGFQKEVYESSAQLRKEFDELREFNSVEIKLLTDENEQVQFPINNKQTKNVCRGKESSNCQNHCFIFLIQLKTQLDNQTKSEEKAKYEEEIRQLTSDFELKVQALQTEHKLREQELKTYYELREKDLKVDLDGKANELNNEVELCEVI
jgi:hypothetical protein